MRALPVICLLTLSTASFAETILDNFDDQQLANSTTAVTLPITQNTADRELLLNPGGADIASTAIDVSPNDGLLSFSAVDFSGDNTTIASLTYDNFSGGLDLAANRAAGIRGLGIEIDALQLSNSALDLVFSISNGATVYQRDYNFNATTTSFTFGPVLPFLYVDLVQTSGSDNLNTVLANVDSIELTLTATGSGTNAISQFSAEKIIAVPVTNSLWLLMSFLPVIGFLARVSRKREFFM